eukprot:3112595-Karenia_brevis.AAC.1
MHVLKEEAHDHQLLRSMFSAWRGSPSNGLLVSQRSMPCNPSLSGSMATELLSPPKGNGQYSQRADCATGLSQSPLLRVNTQFDGYDTVYTENIPDVAHA